MSFVVEKLLDFLIQSNEVEDNQEQREIYRYGLEIGISSLLNIFIILLLGILLNGFLESVIFLVVFIITRLITGGYHADTYLRCNILTCSSFVIVFALFKFILKYHNPAILIAIQIINAVSYTVLCLLYAPVENENKPLSKDEQKKFKILSLISGSLYVIISILLLLNGVNLAVMIVLTQMWVSALIIAAKIKERRKSNEGNKEDRKNP